MKRGLAVGSVFVCTGASAAGATGPPGLLEAYLLILAFACIVPAGFLLGAFAVKHKAGARTFTSVLLTLPAIAYAPFAGSCFFVVATDLTAKSAGLTGAIAGVSLLFYYVSSTRLRVSMITVLAAPVAVLLWIPNAFWKGPTLSFERVEFIDNLAGRGAQEVLTSTFPKEWLALRDGRTLYQTEPTGRSSGISTAAQVVLEEIPSSDRRQWFAITLYNETVAYRNYRLYAQPKYVVPLRTKTHDKYREIARSRGYAVDASAPFDFMALLLEMLARDTTYWSRDPGIAPQARYRHWAAAMIKLGRIDINSPRVLKKVFRRARGQGLLFLLEIGLDPRATDTEGNTVLHAAARLGDFRVVEKLFAYPVDPEIENDRGRTAREEMRVHYRGRASSLKRTDALFLRLQTGQGAQ